MSQKYEKLKALLRELFQLDQPDLDFGLYRIMRARSAEITQFLDHDLLPQVKEAFKQYQSADTAELAKTLAEKEAHYRADGIDPDTVPGVTKLREQLKGSVDLAALESEVYDHLYSFFRRYYSEGDFLAKRVYKPGVYAIPYEGEEVALHWANKDQYYIKTSEYLRDYAFRLRPQDEAKPLRVHFRLVDAAEGEHGDVKGKDRAFVLVAAGESDRDFISEEDGELIIRFEYRPATVEDWPQNERKGKTKPPKQADLIKAAAAAVLGITDEELRPWLAELAATHKKVDGAPADYSRLEAHLRRYTARNTFDYFIHKDLGAFLRRELDFYIKNEVMHLDDLENESVSRVEQYLSKVKVLRLVASKLISFLAQLENFQKRLWLKKKFVTESRWLIRLDQIPKEYRDEVFQNSSQIDEWHRLYRVGDFLPGVLEGVAQGGAIRQKFLEKFSGVYVDTNYFSKDFAQGVLGEIDGLDERVDGVICHGDNFQALRLIGRSIKGRVSNVFIDPPYNTGDDGFSYKDNYKSSSWLSMMADRIAEGYGLLREDGVFFISIGDEEQEHLSSYVRHQVGKGNLFATLVWEKKKKGSFLNGKIVRMKDYVLCMSKDADKFDGLIGEVSRSPETYPVIKTTNARGTRVVRAGVESKFRLKDHHLPAGTRISSGNMELILVTDLKIVAGKLAEDVVVDSNWIYSQDSLDQFAAAGDLYITQDLYFRRVVNEPRHKRMRDILPRIGREGESDFRAFDVDNLARYGWGSNEDANDELHQILGEQYVASYPKPSKLLTLLLASSRHQEGVWLDYFAGSGTSGHAVINLNRVDGCRRKFVLVEFGDYFESVLISRLKKVAFSPSWQGGAPKQLPEREETLRSPRVLKLLGLESYEDTLANLELRRPLGDVLSMDFNSGQLKRQGVEQYFLSYMLALEAQGSQSLLNISAFSDPEAYKIIVKRPGTDESRETTVDLLETFNYLIGLTVQHIAAPRTFRAEFEEDSEGRLQVKGRIRQEAEGPWWFRTVTGVTPDGRKTLIVWRKLTGNAAQDNLVLEDWFKNKQAYSVRDTEFDLIYVNGDNTLENLKLPDETWKVRLIEEDFHRLMFAGAEA